jgi:DNA-binding transcriptional MerR regulator
MVDEPEGRVTAARSGEARGRATTGLRMRDLTRETGLTRETIHFYIAQGLLPPGTKTGRNTAEYGRAHLERLQRIRELQAQHFLPLRAIKALLADELSADTLTPEQEALLARVRATLPHLAHGGQGTVRVADVAGDRLPLREVEELRAAGIIDVTGRGRAARVSAEDAEILRAWAAARAAGIGPERGVHPVALAIYDSAIRDLVRHEVRTFSRAFADRPTSEATAALERILPLIEPLLAVLHRKHVRRALGGSAVAGE